MIPDMKATGKKIAMTAAEAAMAAKPISRVLTMVDSIFPYPFSLYLKIFSKTMIASSTTIPMARVRPKSVNVLSV